MTRDNKLKQINDTESSDKLSCADKIRYIYDNCPEAQNSLYRLIVELCIMEGINVDLFSFRDVMLSGKVPNFATIDRAIRNVKKVN
jgi:hypothetical protein